MVQVILGAQSVSAKPKNYHLLSEEQKLLYDKHKLVEEQVNLLFDRICNEKDPDVSDSLFKEFNALTAECLHGKPTGTPCITCDEVLKILFPDEYNYSFGQSNDIYW